MTGQNWAFRVWMSMLNKYPYMELTCKAMHRHSKLLEAFVNYPQDILTKAVSDIHEEFAKKFDMDKFPIEPSEKHNPLNQMRPMQEILIVIQTWCVVANDEIYNLIVKNTQQRPNDLNEVQDLELMLRAQVHIYELGKFESPGSRDEEFAIKFC